jgi:peptidoglycan hydrolase CwlO-like protein
MEDVDGEIAGLKVGLTEAQRVLDEQLRAAATSTGRPSSCSKW